MGTNDSRNSVVPFVAIRDIRGQFTTDISSECLSGLLLRIERASDDLPKCFRVPSPVAFGILRRTIRCTRALNLILANGGPFVPARLPSSFAAKTVVNEMRYKTLNSLRAQLVDHDGANVSSEPLTVELDGLACHSDSVLNYADLPFAEETALRGGYPRLAVDEKGNLTISVEVDSRRKLTPKELRALREDFAGQLTDGIGAGCFDELTTATGIAVAPRLPLTSKCTQTEGTAWRPRASTKKGNEQRIAAAAKLVKKMDLDPPKTCATLKSTAHEKDAVKIPDKQKKPNLNKLFRLLAKPERNQLFDQIKSELEACGNDLSMVGEGEYPYGNFSDPKLLRLLLNAGLPPETTDVKRYSLLIQAACDPKSIELLLKHSVNINRVCDGDDATALIRAARLGNRKSVELLLKYGADPALRNKAGRSAIDVVDKRSRDRQVIIDLLQSRSGE